MFTTWDSSGAAFMTWNDGWGPSDSGASSGGCSRNIGLSTISSDLTTAAKVNCMDSFGTIAQANTGGWTDGKTWKSGGILAINDGSTAAGLYWSVMRQLDTPPWTRTFGSIMYSSDGGTTWCNPAASCSTSGAPPAANTGEFTDTPTLGFVQYEQGATGTLNVDCQGSYIYAYGTTGDFTNAYLLRGARGTNLQSFSNWQYYSGAVGGDVCTSGNWTSTFTSATKLIGTGTTVDTSSTYVATYIAGFGYLLAETETNGTVLYKSSKLTGPWAEAYADGKDGQAFSFVSPILSTMAVDGSGNISMYLAFAGSYLTDTNTGSTPYSPHFRLMHINAP